jgi:hypothetical protein
MSQQIEGTDLRLDNVDLEENNNLGSNSIIEITEVEPNNLNKIEQETKDRFGTVTPFLFIKGEPFFVLNQNCKFFFIFKERGI